MSYWIPAINDTDEGLNSANNTEDDALTVNDELDEVFGQANPNPDRVGCPSREVLSALARKQRPIDDPDYLHLTKCSECYVEARVLQASLRSTRILFGSTMRGMMAAAAVALTIGGGTWFMVRRSDPRENSSAQASLQVEPVRLDLRSRSLDRGDAGTDSQLPVLLRRARVGMTILLPVGTEPGAYELELIDTAAQVRTSATGMAIVLEFTTTLYADLDTTSLPPGRYQLGIRAPGQDWRFLFVSLN